MPISPLVRVYAICGASCTGKTLVGRRLAHLTGMKLRSCGDAIRARAEALDLSVADLSRSEHEAIDAETRVIAERATENIIIEGTYLDIVLAGIENLLLLQLSCTPLVRAARMMQRGATHGTFTSLDERDALDKRIREYLYGASSTATVKPYAVLDTTQLSEEDCAMQAAAQLTIQL